MAHNFIAETWDLTVKEMEKEKLKEEILEEARKEARKAFAEEQYLFVQEQRKVLARLTVAAEEAERCAIQYQSNIDKFLRK